MYILFEGIDTCGKSTQIELLCNSHPDFLATKEPGQTKLGKSIRELILHSKDLSSKAELFLFLSDRAEHYEKIIKPNQDKIILSDRGFISGLAYALCNQNDDLDFLLRANRYALDETVPDKIVFFKTSEDLLKQRLENKSHDNIEKRGIEYLLKVQENMEKVINSLRIDTLVIDAGEKKEKITEQIERFLV